MSKVIIVLAVVIIFIILLYSCFGNIVEVRRISKPIYTTTENPISPDCEQYREYYLVKNMAINGYDGWCITGTYVPKFNQ